MEERGGLDEAFRQWTALLGAERASRDSELVDRYARSNVLGSPRPAGVLRPADREQAIALVRIAGEQKVPLYPISRGYNWGYGAACPAGPGQVVVDLRDLNRVIEVNAELGYAVVEPGVSQAQLYAHLEKLGVPVMMDCTDAAPDTSVLGNIVDRGKGFSPYGDRFANACGLEVVLADGSVLQTGLGHYPGARAKSTHKWGIGPILDGLFTQSNMGLVLSLTTWLMRKPESYRAMYLVTPPGHFDELIDGIRELRLAGVLPSTVHVVPGRWESKLVPDGTRLTMGAIYGAPRVVEAYEQTVRETLGKFSTCMFADPLDDDFEEQASGVLGAMGIPSSPNEEQATIRKKILRTLRSFALLHRGVPMGEDVQLITPHPRIEDPIIPMRGHYSYGPICPARGKDAAELIELIGTTYQKHGFSFTGPSIAFVNPRTVVMIAHLVFDRSEAGCEERAKACVDELIGAFIARGFPPYRVGIQSMNAIDPHGDTYWKTVRTLKAALDPDDVFAPGRYLPPAQS